jgi:fructose-1,6-bisphosphatase
MDEYGMYGESMNYVYWFDAQGNYHQYFPSGGTFLHISDKPLRIKKSSLTFTQE